MGEQPNKYSFINQDLKLEIENIIKTAKKIINTDLLPIIKTRGEGLEGNIFMYHLTTDYTNDFFDKQVNLILAAKKQISVALEIGFNAGFSALLMLLANDSIKITCVDICDHSYTKPCFKKLKEMFNDRIDLIPGDSTIVLPTLINNKYDLIHIDGCHIVGIAESDIQNSLKMCKSGTILIMDDTERKDLMDLWIKYCRLYNLLGFYYGNFVKTRFHTINAYP
jgi:hypothetical protein